MGNQIAKNERPLKINFEDMYPNHIFDLKTFQPLDLQIMNVFRNQKEKYFFHATKACYAIEIISNEFQLERVKSFNLGKGIFLTRNLKYSEGYGRFIFVCKVDLGKIYYTNQYNHPLDFNYPEHDTVLYSETIDPIDYNKGGKLHKIAEEYDLFRHGKNEYCVRDPKKIELLYLIEFAPFDYIQNKLWGLHECVMDFKKNYTIDENTFFWSIDFSELFYFKFMKKIDINNENGYFLFTPLVDLRIVSDRNKLNSDLIMFGHIYIKYELNFIQLTQKNLNLFKFILNFEHFIEIKRNNTIYFDVFGLFGQKPTYMLEEQYKISAFGKGGTFYSPGLDLENWKQS